MPRTFGSDIGHVQERGSDQSFSDEFRGASDSLIERDRPPRPLDIGRRGRRMMFWLIFAIVVVAGGGTALWYWSEPIGEWIASWNAADEPQPATDTQEPEPAPVQDPPTEPDPTKVFGVKGVEGSETSMPVVDPPVDPTGGEGVPVEPLDTEPLPKPASVSVASTTIRGKVSSASVGSRLAVVDKALEGCWTSAAARPETKRPATLTLSFGIKWNGRSLSSSIEGDAPAAVQACVREALPGSGWPQPRDGGDASVVRRWTLE